MQQEAERVQQIARLSQNDGLVRRLTIIANTVARTGEPALCVAAQRGWADCLLSLLGDGFDVNVPSKEGRSVLYIAASSGHLDCVDTELVLRLEKNAALHAAAWFGHAKIVKTLLDADAGPDTKSDGQRPLHVATGRGHVRTMEVLLECGALVDAVDDNQRTALHVAFVSGCRDLRVFECLRKHGARTSLRDKDGKNALELAGEGQEAAREALRRVLAELAQGSDEWEMVRRRVHATLPQANLVRVEEVRNKRLKENFEYESARLWCRDKEYKLLFHGTCGTPPKSIYNGMDGFDMRFSNKGLWGKALYFAQDCKYSHDYKHKTSTGQFQMFLADVFIGDCKKMAFDRDLTHPPLRPPNHPDHDFGPDAPENLRYNSVKGHTGGSDVFMVYSNGQAYPKYLITYTHP